MLALLFLAALAASAAAREPRVVIPFDFESRFDDGRYGAMVGDLIWRRLDREGGFILPESMLEVRSLVRRRNLHVSGSTPLDEVGRVVREDFDAHVAIFGSVERVPGHQWDVYDLTIKCVDFSEKPEGKVVYETTARTESVSEIPHRYVQEMLDALYDRRPQEVLGPDPMVERNWEQNPNLVVGDFQSGSGGVPRGWEPVAGQQREPLGRLVRWLPEAGNPENRVVRFTFDTAVGDTTGVMYYSDWFPLEEGATYRFQCRWRSNGPTAMVFIKGYDEIAGEYAADAATAGGSPSHLQRREVYRSQVNLEGDRNTWNTRTEDFTPRHTQFTPRWGRVMLYAYLGEGVVEFDDVVVKQIVPASPGAAPKRQRPSLETDVTVEDIESRRAPADPSPRTRP